MQKKILILVLGVLLLSGCGKVATLKNGEDAVVSFKKDGISKNDLYDEMKDRYAISILIDMIDEEILNKEYPDVTEDQQTFVDDNVESMKSYYPEESEFLQVIKYYYGVNSEEELRDYLSLSYLRDLAVKDYVKDSLKDSEIEEYYNDNIVGDIKCSHILISPEITSDMSDEEIEKANEAALKEAKDLIKQLDSAKDVEETFATLAKEHSDDTASATNGGDLGFFNKGEMYTEFETAAYALKKGKYTTDPVETSVGYHIILKTDTKKKASLKDSKEEIEEVLISEKLEDNQELQIDALVSLREKYGMKIEDDELKKQYDTYIANLKASVNTAS